MLSVHNRAHIALLGALEQESQMLARPQVQQVHFAPWNDRTASVVDFSLSNHPLNLKDQGASCFLIPHVCLSNFHSLHGFNIH